MFGQTVDQPPEPKKTANIDADTIATNQSAIPVPYLAGRQRMALNYIAPVYNQRSEKITTKTGKDETSTVGYTYYGDVAAILCCVGRRHQLDAIERHIIDSEIAWEGTITRDADAYEPVTVNKYGLTRIYWGYPTQPVDPLVLAPIGPVPSTPGFDPRRTGTWPGGDQTILLPY